MPIKQNRSAPVLMCLIGAVGHQILTCRGARRIQTAWFECLLRRRRVCRCRKLLGRGDIRLILFVFRLTFFVNNLFIFIHFYAFLCIALQEYQPKSKATDEIEKLYHING